MKRHDGTDYPHRKREAHDAVGHGGVENSEIGLGQEEVPVEKLWKLSVSWHCCDVSWREEQKNLRKIIQAAFCSPNRASSLGWAIKNV